MDSVIQRFAESGDAGWDITDDMAYPLIMDMEAYPDILFVRWKDREYLLNRTYLSKPKVIDPRTNGAV